MSNSNSQKPLIVILGSTASGKTGWAMKLCQRFSGEIVSADSRQIYREMNIGTAKSPQAQISNFKFQISKTDNEIKQHLIDIVDPDESFTLSDYKELAIKKINDIHDRGKIPFLVGGTGLYISSVVDNLDIPEVAPDKKLRAELERKNTKDLRKELKILDPVFYEKIDLNNRRRLIRAIEVCKITGNPFSSLRKKGKPLFNVLQIGIDIPREELNKKIDKRVDEMREAGLEEEVRNLSKKYSWDLLSMSGIGYQEFRDHLDCYVACYVTIDDVFEEIKKHTRQYAKKQMTWFRRDKSVQWTGDFKKAELLVLNALTPNPSPYSYNKFGG